MRGQRHDRQWRLGEQWAVREGLWKIICNPRDPTHPGKLQLFEQQWFLSNLETDPGEHTNFAASNPEILTRLRKLEPD